MYNLHKVQNKKGKSKYIYIPHTSIKHSVFDNVLFRKEGFTHFVSVGDLLAGVFVLPLEVANLIIY
jgi:hypothetical protein